MEAPLDLREIISYSQVQLLRANGIDIDTSSGINLLEQEFKIQSRKKKPRCTKKPCGGTCISTKKACLQSLSPEQKKLAQKAQKAMAAGKIGNAVDLPEPPKPEEKKLTGIGIGQEATIKNPFNKKILKKPENENSDNFGSHEFKVVLDNGTTVIGNFLILSDRDHLRNNINFSSKETVDFLAEKWNGNVQTLSWGHSARNDLTDSERRRIARQALKEGWPKTKEKLEPGSVVINSPIGGAGAARDRAYQREGFGKVHKNGYQYAFVDENRNLVPIEFDKIEYKNKAGKANPIPTNPEDDIRRRVTALLGNWNDD